MESLTKFEWIGLDQSRTRSGGAVARNDWMAVSSTALGGPESKRRLCVTLYPPALAAARWMIGDKVILGVSPEEGRFVLRRVQKGGFSLTPCGGNVGKSISGKSARAVFHHPKNTPIIELTRLGAGLVQVVEDMVFFTLPGKVITTEDEVENVKNSQGHAVDFFSREPLR